MLVTRSAPDFTADAVYPDFSIAPFTLSSLRGKYVVLFFYPMDFTFVCPSEIIAFDRALDEFKNRNCALVSVSTDSAYTHYAWKSTEVKKGGIGNIRFPMVSDITKSISREYGVLYDDSVALRGLFLIDRDGFVQHAVINNLSIGRNVPEVLRVLDALQFHEKYGDVCPANWHPGEDAMKGTADGVAAYLSKHC